MENQGKIKSLIKGEKWNDFQKYNVYFEGDKTKYQLLEAKGYIPQVGDLLTYKISNEKYSTIIRVGGITETPKIPEPKNVSQNVVRTPWMDKDKIIVLQTCIKAAAERHQQSSVDDEKVIQTAKAFFNFIDQNR
jgi:hypothetical protein